MSKYDIRAMFRIPFGGPALSPGPAKGTVNAEQWERARSPSADRDSDLLLADVEGSVRQWEGDEKAATEATAQMDAVVEGAVGRNSGARPVEQGEGDSFVAAFARASDAVSCALDIQ